MLIAKHFPGAAETGLNLIVDRNNIMRSTEGFELPGVVDRQKIRTASLIGLRQHPGNLPCVKPSIFYCLAEKIKRCIGDIITAGKWKLNKAGIRCADPFF